MEPEAGLELVPPERAAPRFELGQRRAITLALALVTALAAFEGTVVSTAMPTIIQDLGGLGVYSWVFALYLLAATITMPLFGRIADLHGRRRVLLFAITCFTAGALLCATASSMPRLILARGLQGLGAGGLLPISMTVLGDLYTLRERARLQGLFSSVWGGAALLGPPLGAWLTISFGWRSVFTVNLPLGLLAFGLVHRRMRESRPNRAESFDLSGALLLASGIGALMLSTLRGGEIQSRLEARWLLVVLGALSLSAFLKRQKSLRHPLVPPSLLSRRETAMPYLAGLLLGTLIYGVDTFVPLFVQGAKGGTAAAAGAVVTPVVLLWAVSAAMAARHIVRHGFRRTAIVGASLILVGVAGLVLAALLDAGVPWIAAACALVGSGLGPSSVPQILAIQQAAGDAERGVATSLVPFARTMGGSLGVSALGALLSLGLASRLGPGSGEPSSWMSAPAAGVASESVRRALESSLLPVFVVLLGLAIGHLLVARSLPGKVS